jgi:hypothetical protein
MRKRLSVQKSFKDIKQKPVGRQVQKLKIRPEEVTGATGFELPPGLVNTR